jgi:hypothetical protein
MRPAVPLAAAALLALALACGADTEQHLVPSGGQVAPVEVGVDPYAGRWPAVRQGGEGEGDAVWGLAAPCGDQRFVQVRSDGIGGWELLFGAADELRIVAVRSAEPTDGGARFEVAPDPLDRGAAAAPVELTWVEPGRIARFSAVPDAWFAAPDVIEGLPAACD